MVITIYIDHVVEKTVYYARSQTHISSVNINYSRARVGLMYEDVYVPRTNNLGTGTISNNLGGSPLCITTRGVYYHHQMTTTRESKNGLYFVLGQLLNCVPA